MAQTPWFAVDKKGLKQILARKGIEFVVFELVQNTWDENTTNVQIELRRKSGTRKVTLKVEDDNPKGFANLDHAFTLFAESAKKDDPEKRGRFNLGEKLVLALCEEAEIVSTTGTIRFTPDQGRIHNKRSTTGSGSVFRGTLAMTDEDIRTCTAAIMTLIQPPHIKTYFNGEVLPTRTPIATFEATLGTEISDAEGNLRSTKRKTTVQVYEPLYGETPTLYEMGIPVVATNDRWHVNILQKVPLNVDRDNVQPAYLAYVRAQVLDHLSNSITKNDANATWVKDAVTRYGDDLSNETVTKLVDLRFGPKRVIYDPSDPEANKLAVSKGYQVVHGGSLSSEEWSVIKRSGAMLPAGQVTPSPKPFGVDGRELDDYPLEKWTQRMHEVVRLAKVIARKCMNAGIEVRLVDATWWKAEGKAIAATYGRSQILHLNVPRLRSWFDGPLSEILDLLIHEFGHHYSLDHLSKEYHDALTRLGGQVAVLALDEPELFAPFRPGAQSLDAPLLIDLKDRVPSHLADRDIH